MLSPDLFERRDAPEGASRGVLPGLVAAAIAIGLRLILRADVAGDQAIFSYPAIVIATLLFGRRAGIAAGAVCFAALWYFVIPVKHSLALAGPSAVLALAVYAGIGGVLVWAIDTMQSALARYRALTRRLEALVEEGTAERTRIWERSRELLVILGPDGAVAACNPTFAALLGLPASALIGRDFASLLLEEERAPFAQACAGVETGGAPGSCDAHLPTPAGAAAVSWSIVRDPGRIYLVGRDFTAERECARQLRQSQKMESVGQLTGGLAHDFGNLLPPIGLTLDLLRKRHGADPATAGLIDGAQRNVERAGQVIGRLLALARPSRLHPTVRPLAPILHEIAPLLRQALDGRTLSIDLAEALPDVRVDANQLDMALLNLVLNARDATPPGGTITLAAVPDASGVRITLADDGAGMDAETLARAAEPFFSTKPAEEGTGLGLPMVHNFAVAAGGALAIDSTPGAGTRVTIALPRA